MVDINSRVKEIYHMVDEGDYFTIHRARQYGKTTILTALAKALTKDYLVVSMDFQALGNDSFQKETIFSLTFANYFIEVIEWSYPHLSKEKEALQNKNLFIQNGHLKKKFLLDIKF